jgi:hypothetical protein
VPGALIIAIVLVIVIPVAVCMSGAVVAALLGWTLRDNGEVDASDELIKLS